jgi:hypothetical protein
VCDTLHIKELSLNEIRTRIRLADSFYRALLEQSKNDIGEHATEPYIKFLANRFIDQEWESFKNVYWHSNVSI